MEVAREKPLTPTIFDVVAPRGSQTSTGGASFRDCLAPPSNPSSANGSSAGTSATASRPPEPSPRREAKPAPEDRDTKHDSSDRAPQAKGEPTRTPSTDDKAPTEAEEDASTSTEVSEQVAEETSASSDESDSSSQDATAAAEVMAAAQAAVLEKKQSPPKELKKGGDDAKATAEAEGAKEHAKSKADSKTKGATTKEHAAANPVPASDMMTTAEVVSARVVENKTPSEAGTKAENAVATPGDTQAGANEEAAPPEQATAVADDSSAIAAVPTVVQAVEPGKQGGEQKEEKSDGEHAAKVAKKSAATEGEAVNAQHAAQAKTTVADAPPSTVVADDSEPAKEERKSEVAEARGKQVDANTPAASPVAADPAIPSVSPPGAEAAAPPSATDLPAPAESNSATTTNNPPPAVPTAPPRVPPALLHKTDSHHSPHARTGEIDPARFLTRVVKAFESAQQRDSEVRLRLHPAELGSLSIEVKVQESALTARVQAETPEARTALLDNLPMLRERLADQGIRIEKFDVDLMDHSDRQPQQSPSEQTPQDGGRRNSPSRAPIATSKAIDKEIKATPASRSGSAADRLNVVI
jgi:flagellar hook-length control protein FliK